MGYTRQRLKPEAVPSLACWSVIGALDIDNNKENIEERPLNVNKVS